MSDIEIKTFSSLAENDFSAVSENNVLIPYGDMLQNYYSQYADKASLERKALLDAVNDAESAAKEVENAAKRVKMSFGEFPQDCPLEPATTQIIEKDGVVIEKVLIQTRKNIHATVLVYRKADAKDTVQPGILLVCGHSDTGKAAPHYQHLAYSVAMTGMTAVIIDPLGQGERKLYPELDFSSVREHNLTGKQLWLAGEFFGLYRVYDAKRAVDYMVSRKDIDPSRLGVAGVSGGGTLSSYTFALDRRIAAAAPSCFITTYKRNFDNELPTDSEQIPQGAWSGGGEMIDLIISRAPAPCLVLSVENDYFDPRGTAESVKEAQKIYSLLGKKDNISLFVGPGSHALPQELRDATCQFFSRHFFGAEQDIPESRIYPIEELLVLNGKMTHQLDGEETITQHIANKMDQLAELRKKQNSDIGKFLQDYLQIPQNMPMPELKVMRSPYQNNHVSMFGVKTEPGAMAILMRYGTEHTFFHLQEHDKVVLYVGNTDSELEMAKLNFPAGTVLYGVDVRGSGKSRSLTCDHNPDFFAMYDCDYFYDATGKLLNNPLIGGKVRDLLATVKLLKSKCRHLTVCGHGIGGVISAYAAAADGNNIDELVLHGVPQSWRSFVNGKDIRWPQSVMIPDSLKYFDMPELYDFIGKKMPLKITAFYDQMMK